MNQRCLGSRIRRHVVNRQQTVNRGNIKNRTTTLIGHVSQCCLRGNKGCIHIHLEVLLEVLKRHLTDRTPANMHGIVHKKVQPAMLSTNLINQA